MNGEKSFIIKTETNYTMVFLSSCLIIVFSLSIITQFQNLYSGAYSNNYVAWLMIFGFFVGFISCVFATFMFLLKKYILINQNGVTVFLGNKIANELNWDKIKFIKYTLEKNEQVYLIIETDTKYIELFKSEFKGKNNEFISILNELIKYQPKYNLYIEKKIRDN
jgi:hypothetical protein